jgi:hypothetical protein
MNHRRAFGATLLLLAVICGGSSSIRAQTASAKVPLIVGTWHLNFEKSGMTKSSPQVFNVRQYSMRDDGFLIGLLVSENGAGRVSFLQFAAKSDGKDYPEFSEDTLAEMLVTGKQPTHTYAERIIDEHTAEWIDKNNGRITSQGRKIISEDGKTLTITVNGSTTKYIYDRQ